MDPVIESFNEWWGGASERERDMEQLLEFGDIEVRGGASNESELLSLERELQRLPQHVVMLTLDDPVVSTKTLAEIFADLEDLREPREPRELSELRARYELDNPEVQLEIVDIEHDTPDDQGEHNESLQLVDVDTEQQVVIDLHELELDFRERLASALRNIYL